MFMLAMYDNKMTDGSYVFIVSGLLEPDDVRQPWIRLDGLDDTAQQAFFPLFQVVFFVKYLYNYFSGMNILITSTKITAPTYQRFTEWMTELINEWMIKWMNNK